MNTLDFLYTAHSTGLAQCPLTLRPLCFDKTLPPLPSHSLREHSQFPNLSQPLPPQFPFQAYDHELDSNEFYLETSGDFDDPLQANPTPSLSPSELNTILTHPTPWAELQRLDIYPLSLLQELILHAQLSSQLPTLPVCIESLQCGWIVPFHTDQHIHEPIRQHFILALITSSQNPLQPLQIQVANHQTVHSTQLSLGDLFLLNPILPHGANAALNPKKQLHPHTKLYGKTTMDQLFLPPEYLQPPHSHILAHLLTTTLNAYCPVGGVHSGSVHC